MSEDLNKNSWKNLKFRSSVVNKINIEVANFRWKNENPGQKIEMDVFEKAKNKAQYLGYIAKIILDIRNMVCIQDDWLQNHVDEILSKPPPRVRKVLSTDALAKHNIDMMKLRDKITKLERAGGKFNKSQ
ncbi:hypothetical protein ABEB36_013226 [Hypothenemus hampei]|uniref:Mediator of RNA polymerase II transcription subunit 15 n=1 Tax=Hypothenemus hampei TaxID=57062 RepID=A0ABD1E7J6_HYPHA